MHLTLKLEIANPAAATLPTQQRRTKQWVKNFNEIRPHEALDLRTPAQIYVPSLLKYRPVRPLEYSTEFELRSVNSKGDIQWLNHRRFIGQAFQGQVLGLRPCDEQSYEVFLGSH
jgi:hypothetical protein